MDSFKTYVCFLFLFGHNPIPCLHIERRKNLAQQMDEELGALYAQSMASKCLIFYELVAVNWAASTIHLCHILAWDSGCYFHPFLSLQQCPDFEASYAQFEAMMENLLAPNNSVKPSNESHTILAQKQTNKNTQTQPHEFPLMLAPLNICCKMYTFCLWVLKKGKVNTTFITRLLPLWQLRHDSLIHQMRDILFWKHLLPILFCLVSLASALAFAETSHVLYYGHILSMERTQQ